MTRRDFMGAAGGAAAMLFLASCGASPSSGGGGSKPASKEVVYAGFGGTYDAKVKQYMFDPFTAQTGIKVVMTTNAPDPIAPIQAQVKSKHPEWDFMILNSATLAESIRLGLCQVVDYNKLPNSKGYTSTIYKNKYGAGLWTFASNMFWNTKAIKGTPSSWADVWDVNSFPGKRGFLSTDPDKTLTVALLADGVSPEKLYPLDLNRAFASLDRIKSHAVFVDINTLTNQIAQQDILLGYQNVTRINTAIKDGIPLKYNWNQYLADISFYSLLPGAAHADAYYKLTNFVLSTQIQSIEVTDFGYSPATKAGVATIPLSAQANLPGTSVTGSEAVYASASNWASQGTEATDRFNSWLQGA